MWGALLKKRKGVRRVGCLVPWDRRTPALTGFLLVPPRRGGREEEQSPQKEHVFLGDWARRENLKCLVEEV